jgi:DNA replication protein
MKSTVELVQIAAAGGGLRLPASSKATVELVQIAAAVSGKAARLFISNAGCKSTVELVQIATAGKGCVVFEFE